MSKTKKKLIVIDNYADRSFLDMIKEFDFDVFLITKTKTKLTNLDKYNSEYHNLTIIYDDTFHDRYFIIDNKTIYHCGASINHAGSKTFSINKLDDELVKEPLLETINEIIEESSQTVK